MAVTNSAVDSCSTSRMSHVAGTMVRYGSTPKPTTPHTTTHSATSAPEASKSRKSPLPVVANTSPMDPPSRAPRTRM